MPGWKRGFECLWAELEFLKITVAVVFHAVP